jgi:hypothetical protein
MRAGVKGRARRMGAAIIGALALVPPTVNQPCWPW